MKIIEDRGLLGIDKQEIDALIAAKKFIGLNRSPRAEKFIVSLTSYKPRINDVKYTIFSLLNQNFPPDMLILWLDEDSFPQREKNLPQDLLALRQFGLTIDWCENLRPYKKLIPALKKFPDDIIITADDDIFYRPDWLKILYDEHVKYPDCIVAHYVCRVRLDNLGNIYPNPHKNWYWKLLPPIPLPPMLCNSFDTGGGVLLKKSFLYTDILKRKIFSEIAKIDDELWFWAMAVLNGTKIKIPSAAQNKVISNDIDMQKSGETLWAKNKLQKYIQLLKIIERYPALLEKLIREAVESKPLISVVAPIKNSTAISACLENFFRQNFPDFELIVINLGRRINLPTLPMNFRVVDYPGGNVADALNLGLRKAAGDYVLFKDETSFLAKEALDIAAQMTETSADVIHFAGHVQLDGNDGKLIIDDKISSKYTKPAFFDAPSQQRAVFWLQNKLSRRLDTKIFRREFLTRHELSFDKNLTEFLFRALVAAEKYLLVPQAFCFCKEEP